MFCCETNQARLVLRKCVIDYVIENQIPERMTTLLNFSVATSLISKISLQKIAFYSFIFLSLLHLTSITFKLIFGRWIHRISLLKRVCSSIEYQIKWFYFYLIHVFIYLFILYFRPVFRSPGTIFEEQRNT